MKFSLSKTKKEEKKQGEHKSEKSGKNSSGKTVIKNKAGLQLPAIFSLLKSRHPVAGLAVVDNILYGITLQQTKNSPKPTIVLSANVPLSADTIVGGRVNNPEALAAAFSKIRAKLKTPFCIFAMPGEAWWSKLFFFPASLTNKQFEESMAFHRSLDLPWESQDVYADWEEISIEEADKRAALIVATKSSTAESFLGCLRKAGWTVLAVEPAALSMIRAIAYFETEMPAMVLGFDGSVIEEMIIWKGKMHFGRAFKITNNNIETLNKDIELELQRLNAYASCEPLGMPKPTNLFFIGSFPPDTISRSMQVASSLGLSSKIFATAAMPWGTALRGLVPLSKDAFISLMPLGTEEAYSRRRASLFVELATNFALLVAFILFITFGGALLFIRNQYQDILKRSANLQGSAAQLSSTIAAAQEFNEVSANAASIASHTPRWDLVYQKIILSASGISGLKINEITLNASGTIQIIGSITESQDLISFRNALQNNDLGRDIRIPPNLFESDALGEFTLNFVLPDTQILYLP